MNQEARLDYLIDYLSNENPKIYEQMKQINPNTQDNKLALFRGLCNIRNPE